MRELETRHPETLAVIGIHSAKFPAEKETANLKEAVRRYGIRHPVVNDRDFGVWQSYGVRAWPTLMFIDPTGKVFGRHEGEFDPATMGPLVSEILEEFEQLDLLNPRLLEYQLKRLEIEDKPLSFPGKIEVENGRLYIADSGHNRLLVTDSTGQVEQVVGSGVPGDADGPLDEATFSNPQGMAVHGDRVYVADADNHNIRLVDLGAGNVKTIAGVGEQSLYHHSGGDPLANPLNSPYDLTIGDGVLYIAMAGFHQLWKMELSSGQIGPFAGDGGEDILDGPRLSARLAQPYGIAFTEDRVYFADSETSSVRWADVGPNGEVRTIVGTGLFDFGDQDGVGKRAVLQHVQGVTIGRGALFIADTYNYRIKRIEPATGEVRSIAGDGKPGAYDGRGARARFNEPAGIAWSDDRLYVADTNNHAIRVIDLNDPDYNVSTIELSGA